MSLLSRLAEIIRSGHDHDLLNSTDDVFGATDIDMSRHVAASVPHDLALLSPEQVHEVGTVIGRRP